MDKDNNRDPFHAGEQRLQEQYGSREVLARNGQRIMLTELTEELQGFFHSLSYVAFACLDKSGRLRQTLLFGKTGFIQIISASKIALTLPEQGHQLIQELTIGAPVALLGIDFGNRRRNRINGRLGHIENSTLYIDIEQAFGNCPKYIQQRTLCDTQQAITSHYPGAIQRQNDLSENMLKIIHQADTSFIVSHCPNDEKNPLGNSIDISHRGGHPGFIQTVNSQKLIIPDYAGNRFFNTLGNLTVNPVAALLIVDFDKGDLLHLSGQFQINHGPPDKDWPAGAERLLEFNLEETELRQKALPLSWQFNSYSPFLDFESN